MNKVLVFISIIVVLVLGFFAFNSFIYNEKQADETSMPVNNDLPEVPSDVLDHMGEKSDMIVVSEPGPMSVISSPLTFRGEARGNWFFEASFPVVLVNWDGLIIAEGIATAQSDWMTEDYVQFEGTIEFEDPSFGEDFSKRGTIIFQKDNPSGLPENDDALEIPILFAE